MTTQELRIAKLSRILNNSSMSKDQTNPAVKAAYSRAYNELQKTIQSEKAYHEETESRQRVQNSIEKQEELIKESMRKHHFNVLKKQIEDQKKKKDINEVEKLLERPNSLPKTPPEPPKFFIGENLKDQIKEKRKKIRESQKNELEYDRFLINVAKNSLETEIKNKKVTKNEIFEGLKQSWNESKVLNNLKKKADRLKYFANLNMDHSVVSPKNNKVKLMNRPRNKTTETSPTKEITQKSPQTDKKQIIQPKTTEKREKKKENDNEQILEKLAAIEERTKKIERQKEAIKKLHSIEAQEKLIRDEKQRLIDYFANKNKPITY